MELQARPFDMETVFLKTRRSHAKKLRGANSPFYSSIWPMVHIARIFGLAPYEYSRDRLVPSDVLLIFSVLAAALYTYIMYVVLQRLIHARWEQPVLVGTENIKVFVNYGVVIYELGLAVCKRRSFLRTWNALQDYDESVRQLGYPRREKQTMIVAWIIIVVTAILWLAVNRSGMSAFLETWLYNVSYMFGYIGTTVAVYKFVGMAFFIGQRFHHLNMIAMENLPPLSVSCKRAPVVSKKTIQCLHNDLMLAAENLESLYSWSLLFWLGNLGIHTVSDIYFIITWVLMTKWEVTIWPLIRCFTFWLLAFLFQLLLLHVACDFASSQANCMGPILIEWQIRLMKRNEEERVESALQYLNRRLNFSAGGCFYVNLPLLRSIAALLTTYLVILLQFPV